MNAPKCELQIGANIGKCAVERRGTCHDHIVEARICAGSGNFGKCCLDPTPHAIADYGTAKLPGDGETKAWQIARGGFRTASAPVCGDNCTLPQSGRGRIRSWSAFHQECRSGPAPTTADALEFRPLLQGGDSHCSDRPTAASMLAAHPSSGSRWPIAPEARAILGRKALAALRAAPCEHALAALGLHPGAESVAAFAHEAAWLIGAFHGLISECRQTAARSHLGCAGRACRMLGIRWASL